MTGPESTRASGAAPKKGERLPLLVERLAFGGAGVAHAGGMTVFVEHGIPGQEVEALVLRRRRTWAEARVVRVLRPSPDEVPPPCPDFGTCGGCRAQHLAYEAQLREKRAQVRDCLIRLGGLEGVDVEPVLPSPDLYGYRNKMEYSFGERWLTAAEIGGPAVSDRFGLGLHPRARFDRVLEVGRCHLSDGEEARLLAAVRDAARTSGLPAWSARHHEGFWRFLVLRRGIHTGERMAHLITSPTRGLPAARAAVQRVAAAARETGIPITSLLHGETDRPSAVAVADVVTVVAGAPSIRETLLGLTFEIGPNTFFQTNTRQAERLFSSAVDRAGLTGRETVWDLYCGAGALSLPAARRARFVRGIEVVEEAVAAGRINARENGVDNVAFEAGDLRVLVREGALGSGPAPDVVLLDPPRDGVHPDVVAAVLAAAPRRVVYVSCNPATLARDLRLFADGGFDVGPVLPVDMFPHTAHVECVAALDRRT